MQNRKSFKTRTKSDVVNGVFFKSMAVLKKTQKITKWVIFLPKFVGLWHWLYHMIWVFHAI